MAATHTSRALLAVFALSAMASAQTAPPSAPAPASSTAPCPASTLTSKPCTPAATPPSASQQFPFPGEPTKPAATPVTPDTPDAPGGKTTPSGAAAEHPFPTAPPPRLPGTDSSSSSSSSGASEDPDSTPDLPPGSEGTSVHRKLPKIAHVQSDDERVDEDINVAKFYMNDENFKGAYLRAKDAVTIQPDYSLAHFTLAQVALKMKKNDEAIAEFNTYLKLDPQGDKKKEAQKALEALK